MPTASRAAPSGTFRIDLKNIENDSVFAGPIYVGSPTSQPSSVILDTGSEYLVVTSNLCDDSTSGKYRFKKFNPDTK